MPADADADADRAAARPLVPWSAMLLDGQGSGRALTEAEAEAWSPAQGVRWMSLDPADPRTPRWLALQEPLSERERTVLTGPVRQTEVTLDLERQRLVSALLVVTELGEGDLVPLRLLLTPRQLVTLFGRPLPAADDARQALAAGRGPCDVRQLMAAIMRASTGRAEQVILGLDERLVDLEYEAGVDPRTTFERLRLIHQTSAGLRRGLARERDLLNRYLAEGPTWLTGEDGGEWKELAGRLNDVISLVDATLERSRALYDYLQGALAAVLNDRLYVLTLISAIMLPLGFVTGLLGVNVGGVPLKDSAWAFWALCGLLAVLALVQLRFARRHRWLPGPEGRDEALHPLVYGRSRTPHSSSLR